jgi:hypothetical protein
VVPRHPAGAARQWDQLSHRPPIDGDLDALADLDPPEHLGGVVAEVAN